MNTHPQSPNQMQCTTINPTPQEGTFAATNMQLHVHPVLCSVPYEGGLSGCSHSPRSRRATCPHPHTPTTAFATLR
jgi:hypothetical protein